MKTFVWTEDMAPEFAKLSDGSMTFFSYPDLDNYSSGDQIHHKTRLGTSVFEIIEIAQANLRHFDPSLQRITAKKLD